MADDKNTDIHKPDGIFIAGEKVGHADAESRIRKRDGLIFRGEEIGYIDAEKQVRRPDGIVFKGQVLGKIIGEAVHDRDGLLFDGEKWGYVDGDGNIRQRDGIFFRGRIIGKMRGRNKDAALGFFVLRFKELEDRFEHLEREARQAEHKGRYVGKIRHMLSYVPEYDGLGDFDELIKRLKNLESDLVGELDGKRRQKVNAKEALIAEAERWSYSTDWKSASAELRLLQSRWKAIGRTGVEEERLWQHFRSSCDRFFQRRSAHFEELNHERARNASLKEELILIAESLRHSDDLKSAAGRVKNLQQQWKGIGPASKDLEPRLWDHFRHACDQVFEASHQEWERKNREWRDRMHDVLRAKREQVSRLRGSIEHDEENISRWRHTIHNLRPGGRADEIEDSLEGKIVDVEDRIASKQEKLREIENAIDEIEEKLRR
jgi:hypothetical protein